MFVALFLAVLIVYALNFRRPDDRITRKEYDEALRHLKTKTELVYKEELKIVSKDNQHIALFEAERQQYLNVAADEIEKNRTSWLKLLNELHDRGELDDVQFNNEVNKCLDS